MKKQGLSWEVHMLSELHSVKLTEEAAQKEKEEMHKINDCVNICLFW